MSVGYFEKLADADAWFLANRLETTAWDELATAKKEAALRNAYLRIRSDPRWSAPTVTDATADDLLKLQPANAEMAYYLAVHLASEDLRVGLQAQGVRQAGVVKEAYSTRDLQTLPVPPFVEALLEDFLSPDAGFFIANLGRDENEDANTDVDVDDYS